MTRARLTKLIMFCLGLAIALWWGDRALMSPSAYAQAEEPAVVRSLSLAELPALGIAPEMPALIPPNLRQSNHPQNRRGIIDGDERVEMLSRSYPWSAIELIILVKVKLNLRFLILSGYNKNVAPYYRGLTLCQFFARKLGQ